MTAAAEPVSLRIDFVSDVVCPWCAIGLLALEQAIARLGDAVTVDLHFQPFELNPQMPREGQDATEHLTQKYGASPKQLAAGRETIRARGAELGFVFNARDRVYNTFDAHRLLHWAATLGRDQERALKFALLRAYFTDGADVSDPGTLQDVAVGCGLNGPRAAAVLATDEYTEEVRTQEQFYLDKRINSVPSVVINRRHLVSGGQPVELFEQVLREIAAGKENDE